MLVGLLFDVVGVKAVPMRCWSAAVNGVLPPPLMAPILLLTSGRAVMGGKWRARRDSNAGPPAQKLCDRFTTIRLSFGRTDYLPPLRPSA
jgi:Mn2+/Fe2+ NRAMP family transporter